MPGRNRIKDTTFWNIIGYLHERMNPETRSYQVDIETFAHAVGIHQRTLYRHLAELKELHVLRVRRVATDFVGGRQPSVYTLLADPEQLRKMWEPYVSGPLREKPKPLAADDPDLPEHVTPIEDAMTAAILEQLEDLEPDDELAQDAWLAGSE